MNMMLHDELLLSHFKTVASVRDMHETTYTGTGLLLIRHHVAEKVDTFLVLFFNAVLGFVKFCRMFGAQMSQHIGSGAVFWSHQSIRAEQTAHGPRADLLEERPCRAPFPDHSCLLKRLLNMQYLLYIYIKKKSNRAVDVTYIYYVCH